MALEHPLGVGAGNFNSAYGRFYRDRFADYNKSVSHRWISPHSIYFRTLGEYGIPGLSVLMIFLFSLFKTNRQIITQLRLQERKSENNLLFLTQCINMSVVAYAFGGLFLGGIYYPHIYIITFLTLILKKKSALIVDELRV